MEEKTSAKESGRVTRILLVSSWISAVVAAAIPLVSSSQITSSRPSLFIAGAVTAIAFAVILSLSKSIQTLLVETITHPLTRSIIEASGTNRMKEGTNHGKGP